ncbi:MAG: hypothetical protein K6E62_05800 [Lachnospiraceae bacterium]|nr:hypothetical protein [Lachnospiraceae bacterium]
MKEILKKIFLVILCLMFVGYLLVTAIIDLTNKNDIYTLRVDGAAEILELEHSINGLIPVGTDHFYLGIENATGKACIIKASKRWYKKNFDENGYSLNPDGLTVTALAKKAGKYDVERELKERAAQFDSLDFIIDPGYALDLSYKLTAILKLVLLALSAGIVLFGIRIAKAKDTVSKPVVWVFTGVLIVYLIVLLVVIV